MYIFEERYKIEYIHKKLSRLEQLYCEYKQVGNNYNQNKWIQQLTTKVIKLTI